MMGKRRVLGLGLAALCVWGVPGVGARVAWGEIWSHLERMPQAVLAGEACIRPEKYASFELDLGAFVEHLKAAPSEGEAKPALRVTIPMPDGSLSRFDVVESSVVEPALAARYPQIRTYRGQGVDERGSNLRFDVVPGGFHASILGSVGEVYVDPVTRGDDRHYASYFVKDHAASRRAWRCDTPDGGVAFGATRGLTPGRSGAQLRVYRLACSLTGEATTTFSQLQGHAANTSDGLAALVSVINRVDQIMENELAIRLILVANNDQLIFTNATTDPFTDPNNATTTNTAHHNYLVTNIGTANFDLGHVIHTGTDFGNAGFIGSVCNVTNKGQGMSSANPVPLDNLAVKLVCHELGHQFGANHSFNSCFGSQGGPIEWAIEPGSGTTIMGYLGICQASENLPQATVDPIYNSGAYDQIQAYTTAGVGGTCPVLVATGNTPPSVDAGAGYVIPKQTHFELGGLGIDSNGDVLSYAWEDRSQGPPLTLTGSDNGQSPLERVRAPGATASRSIPALAQVLSGQSVAGERLPWLGRAWPFRLTARDNRSGGGGVATDDMIVTVAGSAGPFSVTSPNTNVRLSGPFTVRWNVAGTDLSPILTSSVRIRLSVDGGLTYPHVLASAAPNTGQADVLLPNIESMTARVRVEAVGNIFYDVSDVDFQLVTLPPGVVPIIGGPAAITDVAGNCNRNGMAEPGESGIEVRVPIRNVGATTGTGIVGVLSSQTPGVQVLRASAAYPPVAYGGVVSNSTAYLIRIDPSMPCGTVLGLRLGLSWGTETATLDFGVPTSHLGDMREFEYTGGRQLIPDVGSRTLNINVGGVTSPIGDVDFLIGGSACSAASGLATAGIAHNAVNQLRITLTGPGANPSSVVLWDRHGGVGHNLCSTTFDDSATDSVESLTAANAPYSGSWSGAGSLAAFNGQMANGSWSLVIEDAVAGALGSFIYGALKLRESTCDQPRCFADVDDGSGTGVPDGAVTVDDLLLYLAKFEAGDASMDVDDGSNTGAPDGAVTIDDLVFYLARFEDGC